MAFSFFHAFSRAFGLTDISVGCVDCFIRANILHGFHVFTVISCAEQKTIAENGGEGNRNMRKKCKIFAAFLTVVISAAMLFTVYAEMTCPNEIYVGSESICLRGIFYADNTLKGTANDSSTSELTVMNVIPVKEINLKKKERRYVVPGGELVGIALSTDGVVVVATENFESTAGTVSPAKAAGIRPGDVLISANGKKLKSNEELTDIINETDGRPVEMKLMRGGEDFTVTVTPEKTLTTKTYKCGMWIRDYTGGIGTLTYADTVSGTLAALGHGIYDTDTSILLPVASGSLRNAEISSLTKGQPGAAGEICGVIGKNIYGSIETNSDEGIYGCLAALPNGDEQIPVANKSEVHVGAAQIICTVENGEKQYYDINIDNVVYTSSSNKSITVRVTDPRLIAVTGGIVQGMSGSPIIQDGMLAGAVTHVFINNPRGGYAVFAEDMMSLSDSLIQKEEAA